ncbi:serine/threonine-protein phosphatase 2A 56 kDa regulatory subunit beta isoform [Platysternon megacephalum]|uniref:Serine/threonine-protein phosphatase 2A 56 kDa regulatory subunit beta isoform n=1 Tax=Platysternon megacephalum TaxID=55544 RepID=A0A4D9ETR2_9SAUR|nr:serine/threonine-protein phosphatase 2A 56 kDa regulatory subunit beta isoform [Platysternon megacephalum]
MFIMPILIIMQSNGFKAYIFNITGHHKPESILYCHYTSMFVFGYTYIQKLFTHLNLAISSFETNIILLGKQLFNKWYKKYSKAHFFKKLFSLYHLKKHKNPKCCT